MHDQSVQRSAMFGPRFHKRIPFTKCFIIIFIAEFFQADLSFFRGKIYDTTLGRIYFMNTNIKSLWNFPFIVVKRFNFEVINLEILWTRHIKKIDIVHCYFYKSMFQLARTNMDKCLVRPEDNGSWNRTLRSYIVRERNFLIGLLQFTSSE